MTTAPHDFRPGDIVRHTGDSDGPDEVVVPSVYGDASVTVRVRQPSGLVQRANVAMLRHVPITAEHVGAWARIAHCEIPDAVGRVGRIAKIHDGTYRAAGAVGIKAADGRCWHFVAEPGDAVLVAEPETPEVPMRLREWRQGHSFPQHVYVHDPSHADADEQDDRVVALFVYAREAADAVAAHNAHVRKMTEETDR